jgi:late competence protein required for DNA uptake (superfamily II DNA/RNA helicase)
MAICQGKRRSTTICNSVVYRCENCTNVGCDQVDTGECSNQGFRSNNCLMCGRIRLRERLAMTPQLEEAMKILRLVRTN